MERDPVEGEDAAVREGHAGGTAVDAIAEKRRAGGARVNAELVGTARDGGEREEREGAGARRDGEVGPGRGRVAPVRGAVARVLRAADGRRPIVPASPARASARREREVPAHVAVLVARARGAARRPRRSSAKRTTPLTSRSRRDVG